MRSIRRPLFVMAFLFASFLFVIGDHPHAQKLPNPVIKKTIQIPEIITLAKEAKLGKIEFNHTRHNGGEYSIGGQILCVECHHTAQPKSQLVKFPPFKTEWPTGRTTTLTTELFSADPKAAGVASCRDCHAREGKKPKLLRNTPVLTDPGTGIKTKLTNLVAFHQACDVCHYQISFRASGSLVPDATSCATCHKSK